MLLGGGGGGGQYLYGGFNGIRQVNTFKGGGGGGDCHNNRERASPIDL